MMSLILLALLALKLLPERVAWLLVATLAFDFLTIVVLLGNRKITAGHKVIHKK